MIAFFGTYKASSGTILSILVCARRVLLTTGFVRPSSLKFRIATGTSSSRSSTSLEAVDSSTYCSSRSRAMFLDNDGEWVRLSNSVISQSSSSLKLLDGLSLQELQQRAQQEGRTSTGSKKESVEWLSTQKSPAPTRPVRRNHSKLTDKPPGYVERQDTARPPSLHAHTPQLRVLSWNVNGIRAQMDKEEGREALRAIVEQERPHVLGLQETRITAPIPDAPSAPKKRQRKSSPSSNFTDTIKTILPDYDTVWLSSVPPARQGYSGTALLIRKRREWDIGCPKLLNIRGGIGHPKGDLEGRVITAELDVAFVVNVYAPNSGAGLKRLDFRVNDWDQAFAEYVRGLEKIKPVVVVGDFNVALLDIDFYNPEQKRMQKSAGTTPEERASFAVNLLGRDPPASCAAAASSGKKLISTDEMPATLRSLPPPSLPVVRRAADGAEKAIPEERRIGVGDDDDADDMGGGFLVDTFREIYPDARGVFTYWSVRARNRPLNRGMRLDYCLASRRLVSGGVVGKGEGMLHDAFVLDRDTVGVSDHAPVGVVLRLGEHFPE